METYYNYLYSENFIKFIIETNINNWDFYRLSKNNNIHYKSIEKHHKLPWHSNSLKKIQKKEKDFVISTFNNLELDQSIDWSHYNLLLNPNINPMMIKNCKYSDIYCKKLSKEANFNWPELLKLDISQKKWDYWFLSLNKYITWNIVQKFSDRYWNYRSLSRNININYQIIKDNPQYNWCFKNLSNNPNITIDNILDSLDKGWCWNLLSFHSNIDWHDISKYDYLPWNWDNICLNKNITYKIVKNNPQYPWNKIILSKHPNFNWNDILNLFDNNIPLEAWDNISLNVNIDWYCIKKNNLHNSNKVFLNYMLISENDNTLKRLKYVNKKLKLYASIILKYVKINNLQLNDDIIYYIISYFC